MEIISVNKTLITKIINYIYKTTIPSNAVLSILIEKLCKNSNITTIKYKIFGLKLENGNKIYGTNNDYIIENITFINNYSPLLEFYKNNKYEISEDSIIDDMFSKQENIMTFYLRNNVLEDEFLDNEDKHLYDYINGIKNNSNHYKKLIYILTKYNDIDPEYIIDILDNKKFPKIDFNIEL